MRRNALALVLAFTSLLAIATARRAAAAPFEARRVPAAASAVGHVDVDALRKTQLFALVSQKVPLAQLRAKVPAKLRPMVIALLRTLHGVSFWMASKKAGAIYVDADAAPAIGKLLAGFAKHTHVVAGHKVFELDHDGDPVFATVVGHTIVVSAHLSCLSTSLEAMAGKAPSLASKHTLPRPQGNVFSFAAIGGPLLPAIQKAAHSMTLQLDMRSILVELGEAAGQVTLTARAELATADGATKGKSILQGLVALGSIAGKGKPVQPVLDHIAIDARGTALAIHFKMKAAQLVKDLEAMK